MIALLLFLTIQVAPEIVVSGKRLDDAYRECVDRACPPLRDAQVSIAYAERQFRAGAYAKARSTLAAAVARNKRYAATAPKPVAAIYEAYATVALHDGEMDVYRKAVAGQVGTLRRNLPPNDPAVTAVALTTGDMWVALHNGDAADSSYRAVEHRALAQGDATLAMVAALRRVGLASASGYPEKAAQLMAEAEARPAAADPALRPVLQVVRLRLAARQSDDGQVDRLVREIGHDASTTPVLVWAPPYEPSALPAARAEAQKFGGADPVAMATSDPAPVHWADIGFWISPEGKTDDVEILRGSRSTGWASYLVKQISARRYAGGTAVDGDRGVYRIERFTERGTYTVPIGKLVRIRNGPSQLEVLDMTEPVKPAAPIRPIR